MTLTSITDIKYGYYINLDSRPDRKLQIEQEMANLGITLTRFPAIQHDQGAIGCTQSHIACLQTAVDNNLDHVLIVEDDIQFLNPELFKTQFEKCMSLGLDWDVILFAGNNYSPFTIVNDYMCKVTNCQTSTGYLIKGTYISKLLENFKTGLALFSQNVNNPQQYAIDMHWKQLQKTGNWYLITPLTVIQRPNFSNIEQQFVNYNYYMLNLYK